MYVEGSFQTAIARVLVVILTVRRLKEMMKKVEPPSSDHGKQYAAYIESQLQSEEARRSSITERAQSRLTSAGGLVTFVLAVFAVFLGKDFQLTGCATLSLCVAVVALLLGAFCAVRAGSTWGYGRGDPATIKTKYLGDKWSKAQSTRWVDSEDRARWEVAWVNVRTLDVLATETNKQVKWLGAAGALQLISIIALVVSTISVVTTSDVAEARSAINKQPGVSKLLEALDKKGLLNSRDDVVKLTAYYRLTCASLKKGISQSPEAAQKELASVWQIRITVDQLNLLEPARAEFCAAQ